MRYLALVVGLALLAGCAGPKTSNGSSTNAGDTSPSNSSGGPSPTPTASPPPSALNRTMVTKDCQGLAGNLAVPADRIQPFVPEADFDAINPYPGTVLVLVSVLQCREVVANASVAGDFFMFEASVFVDPRNDSWPRADTHRFLLDFRVSSDPVAGWFDDLGFGGQPATFSRSMFPSSGSSDLENWTVRDTQASFDIEGARTGTPGTVDARDTILWYGTAPYSRVELREDSTVDAALHNTLLRSAGQSTAHAVIGDAWPFDYLVAVLDYDSSWDFSEEQIY